MVYVVYIDVCFGKRSSVLEVRAYQICVVDDVCRFGEVGDAWSFLRA